jgi:hypothetical protein
MRLRGRVALVCFGLAMVVGALELGLRRWPAVLGV